jgi:uncharacterized protein YndB with AHSA1/START domain
MKYLKYLLIFVIVLLVAFIANGYFTPSISNESEVLVNKPVAESWAVISDESSLKNWIEGFKKSEHISGTPNTIGAVSKVYIVDGEEEMIMEETITNIVPNKLLSLAFTMDFMDINYEMTLQESDGNTIIKTKTHTAGNGIFSRALLSFMESAMKTQEDINLGNLKKIIEENTKNYFPEPEPIMEKEMEL